MDTESEGSDTESKQDKGHEVDHADIGAIQSEELSNLGNENSAHLPDDHARPSSEDDSSEGESLKRRVRTKTATKTVESGQLRNEDHIGQATSRRRLVQESGDSDSSSERRDQISEAINETLYSATSRDEKRRALQELAAQKKIADEHAVNYVKNRETKSKQDGVEEKNSVKKRKSSTQKASVSKKSKQDIKPQLSHRLKGMIAAALLSKDDTFTKKWCREQLIQEFGEEQIEHNLAFFRSEFDKLKDVCYNAAEDDLKAMAAASADMIDGDDRDDGHVSSDLDKPLKPGAKGHKKPVQKRQKTAQSKPSRPDLKSEISLSLKVLIAAAALSNDETFTKKRCKERMMERFGTKTFERYIDFFREEFDKITKLCLNASEEDLRAMTEASADIRAGSYDAESGSDLDKPLKSKSGDKQITQLNGNFKPSSKVPKPISKTKITVKEKIQGRRDTYTVFLGRIIAASALAEDRSLTKRVCRERLSAEIGLDIPQLDVEYVNREIDRISEDCRSEDKASIRLLAEQPIPQNALAYFSSDNGNQDESDELETGDDENNDSASSGSDLPALSKRSKSRVKGILSGVVIAPCGKVLLQNESALKSLKDLVESNGAKLQSCVTRKVNYVAVATGSFLKKNDSRVASARKHGAKLVYVSFFEECVRQQSMINWTDHAAVHADSHESGSKKVQKDKSAKDLNQDPSDGEDNPDAPHENDDTSHPMETEDNENAIEKKSRRIAARKSKEENEWTKDVKARFSYVKDARSRLYDPKDPVVPEATFVTDKGVLYNTYLTHTEFDEGDEGLTKFFAIKLVEAGGLMKGERWHVVTQWGKVGATKPGCDVVDFDDYKSAIEAFKQRFWEKTRNSWDSSSFAFRTVSGKYTMEELSDDDADYDSSVDENEASSQLHPRILTLVSNIFSTKSADRILETLGVDTSKLDVQKLKGNVVRESYAELVSIQKILQHGSKRSEKEIQRLRGHTDRIVLLLHLRTEDMEVALIDGVNSLGEKTRLVNEIRSILMLKCAKKRFLSSMSSSRNRIDTIYSGLRCHIDVVPSNSDHHRFISKALLGTGITEPSQLARRLTNIFSVKRAGEDWKYAGFSQLDNKMLLWHAVRATTLVPMLLQGMTTAPPETPAVGYPLGKGLYFYDSADEAMVASGISQHEGPVFLILCEVALGNVHEVTRPMYLRRAPHGYHSVCGKGISSFDPTQRIQFPGESGLYSVVSAPDKSFGASDSAFRCNHYVVYDVGQVQQRYICEMEESTDL